MTPCVFHIYPTQSLIEVDPVFLTVALFDQHVLTVLFNFTTLGIMGSGSVGLNNYFKHISLTLHFLSRMGCA